MGRFSEVGKVLKYWNLEKAKRKITRIVIHCSATKQGKYYDAQDIHLWHKARGWAGIGYTYVLLDSGELQQGRGINYTPAQAKGYNKGAIAICLIGGMNDKMIATENAFTVDQLLVLPNILKKLKKMYPKAEILGHRDLKYVLKSCPCLEVSDYT